jgi:hypothetical protein
MITDKHDRTRVRSLLGIDESGLRLSKSHPVKEDEVLAFDEIKEIAIIVCFMKL